MAHEFVIKNGFHSRGDSQVTGSLSATTFNGDALGTSSFGAIQMDDDKAIYFGNAQDLQIWHDGSNSYIWDSGAGRLNIKGGAGVNIISPADETMATFEGNGGVELYYNNNKKFETTNTGILIDYDSLPSSDPGTKGQLYRNGSNQLFISPG